MIILWQLEVSIDNSSIHVSGVSDSPAGVGVQVFDLESKLKLGSHVFPAVVFWRWLAPRTLAIVTETSVFHWSVATETEPVKVFDRKDKCAAENSQVIAYTVDSNSELTVENGQVSNCKWCLLTVLYPGETGTVEGAMMLYSINDHAHQELPGHAGCFGNIQVEENGPPRELVALFQRDGTGHKLMIMARPGTPAQGAVKKIAVPVKYEADQTNDFPVAIHMSEKLGLLFAITKQSFAYIFDIATGTLISRQKIASDPIFLVAPSVKTGGVLVAARRGQIISVGVNDQTLIPYIRNQLGLPQVAMSLAVRYGFPGADEALVEQFKQHFARGDYRAAAAIAGKMKSGALRTPIVMQQFRNAPTPPTGGKPIMIYFQVLLDQGKLNRHESIEIADIIVGENRPDILERWISSDKLELSPELADKVKLVNPNLSTQILLRAGAHTRVIQSLVEKGAFDQIIPYARKNNCQVDADNILRSCIQLRPDLCGSVANDLLDPNQPLLAEPMTVFNLLLQANRVQEACSALFKYVQPNKPDQSSLQTRLLQVAIQHHREGAKSIFQSKVLTYYDRTVIANECERAGLIQLALEHHTDMAAIRRCMLHGGQQLTIEWLTNFLTNQSPENILEILNDLLKASRANGQLVFQAALKFQDRVGASKLASLFEQQGMQDVCFAFLKAIVDASVDPDVHFKFIQVACKLNNTAEVDAFVRKSQTYDAVKVKDLLKEVRLTDHRPLIYVCDRHGFIEEMTEYLYKFDDSNAMAFLRVYVTQVNVQIAPPKVLGTLIDLDCGEDFINEVLSSLRGTSTEALVEAFERRSRLRMLLPFLEQRLNEGSQETAVHNALAKIYIDLNRDAESFLKTNNFYDAKVVGDYCADRDPHLACIAYKRRVGECDDELVAVANRNGLYRMLARYCVERQNSNLWAKVLSVDNEHREGLVDCVTSTALPESTNPDEVNVAVKAFIAAEMPQHLIELLEKIVLHNPHFQGAANLQSLLILTAIKTDPSRVMDYINRLDSYDASEIAKIAASEKYHLYEEAFTIYTKFNMNVEAVDILLNQIDAVDRATEFAQKADDAAVWARVAKAELAQSRVSQAVDCYLRANTAIDFIDMIEAGEREEAFEDLVRYLRMARENIKDARVDSALVYALARTDALTEEFFAQGGNLANLQQVGDRLFEEGYFRPARLVFAAVPNNARLASCFVMLEDFSSALEAAKKAKNPRVWKEVCLACVAAGEFKLAQIAGQHVIAQPDHLEELVRHYERAGHIDHLIDLLDAGLASESAHAGLFTELGILYAKHRPEKLRSFVEHYSKRINIPKLIRACEKYALWRDAVLLHTLYNDFDQAVQVTLAHPATAWEAASFEAALKKISNGELLYRAATFYLDEHPLELANLLINVSAKLDHARAVNVLKRGGGLNALALITPYLRYVALEKLDANIKEVNEALIEIFLEEEDFGALKELISIRDNFDQVGLASRLERHELLEARRTAALLYRSNGRFKQALELSRKDKAYRDVIDTARASGKSELVEELLRGFAESGSEECFAATLYVCYELVRPDVVMELSWRNGWDNASKPYWIQYTKEFTTRIEGLDKKTTQVVEASKKKQAEETASAATLMAGGVPGAFNAGGLFPGQLALMGPGAPMTGAGGFPATPGFF